MDSTTDPSEGGQGGIKRPPEPVELSPGSTTSATAASPADSLAHNGVEPGSGGGKRQRTGDAGAAVGNGVGAAGPGMGALSSQRFDGTGFYLTRLAGEQPTGLHQGGGGGGDGGGAGGNGVGDAAAAAAAAPPTLSLQELLEPRDRLRHVLLVAGTINASWAVTAGLGDMPTSLESPPILLYHNNNDSSRTSDGDRPTPASVLRAASPQLPPEKQWLVYRHMGKGTRGAGSSAVQHAKLTLLRFGPGEGDGHGFLRVVLGSANLYQQWEHSRDVLWVQDFPAIAAPQSPPPPLPAPSNDPEQLRRTLNCFCLALFKAVTLPLDGGLAIEKTLKQRLALLFAGVSTAAARATVLASIPPTDGASLLPAHWNGLNGLGTALASVGWSAAAADAPVTALAGSLGNPADAEWVADLARAMTGHGAHGKLAVKDTEDPGLRIMYPTNATAFGSDPTVLRCLSHNYYYSESKPFPHRLMWQLEAKPGSWPAGALPPVHHSKIMWRVTPVALGPAKKKKALPGLPPPKSEVRGWIVLGSHNLSKAAWGDSKTKPSNFELSALLLTRDPQRAAAWLERLPMNLPPHPGVPIRNLVPALRYPSGVPYTKQAPYAPFTYARTSPQERDEARAAIMG